MNLILMRHSEAASTAASSTDHDRPLTDRGRLLSPRMAEVLVENGLIPKMILVSSSKRTQETVALMLPVLGDVEVKVVKKLYQASPMTILEIIHEHGRGADPLMIVGHNPGLETTTSNIAGNIVPMPTGAIAHASVGSNQVSEVLALWRPDELPAE